MMHGTINIKYVDTVTSGLLVHKELQNEAHFICEIRRFDSVDVKNSSSDISRYVSGLLIPNVSKEPPLYTFLGRFEKVII